MKKIKLLLLSYLLILSVSAQPFASWTNQTLTINNGFIERTIQLPAVNGNFITLAYKPVKGSFNYFDSTSTDFQFEVNNIIYSGRSKWQLQRIEKYTDANNGDGAA